MVIFIKILYCLYGKLFIGFEIILFGGFLSFGSKIMIFYVYFNFD